MSMNEQRVRELAYQIWQSEGCPDGEDSRHWEMACKLAAAEQQPSVAQAPASKTRKMTKPTEATAAMAATAASMPAVEASLHGDAQAAAMSSAPAAATKPRATRTKASTAAPKAATQAAAGTPETIKKPRAPRKKKES